MPTTARKMTRKPRGVLFTSAHAMTTTPCPCLCGKMLRVNQKYASEACPKRVARQAAAEDAPQPERVAEKPERTAAPGRLWPCKQCQGLIYHVSKPRNVCAECSPKSSLISIKVAPRAEDDSLRPVMVYLGTMNVSTRYVDAETVRLLCGVPEAIEPLAAFAHQLDGVAIVKHGATGIDILEALIPANVLRSVALTKERGNQ
jgi:hypothetical protein